MEVIVYFQGLLLFSFFNEEKETALKMSRI